MVKNPKFLKNLLTTASVVALAGFASSAMAAVKTTTGAAATAQDGAGGLVNFNNGNFVGGTDTLALGGAHDITTTGPLNLSAGPINIGGNAHQTFTVRHAVNYGAAVNLAMNLIIDQAAGDITIQDITDAADDATVSAGKLVARNLGHDLIVSGTGNVTARNVHHDLTISGGSATVTAGVGNDVASTGGTTIITGDVGNDLGNTVGNVTVNGNIVGASTLGGAAPGSTKITGNAGGLVTVSGAGVHTTEIGGDVNSATFATDQVITLKNNVNRTVGVVIVTPAEGGTFIADEAAADKTLNFTAAVGAPAHSLKLLQAKGGSTIQFDDATYVKTIDVGTSDSVISLANAAVKIEELKHENNKVTLSIAANTNLLAGTVVSDATHRLKAVVLNGAKTLTLADGVNIYAINSGAVVGTGIYTTGANAGVLVFEGDSIVDAVMPVKINTITLNNVAKTVQFIQAINANGAITIGTGGTMKFGSDVIADKMIGGGAGTGTAEFINDKAATINLVSGGGNALLALKVSGGDLNFTQKIPVAASYIFGDKPATVTVSNSAGPVGAALDLSAKVFTTTSTSANQNIIYRNGDLILGVTGANANHFGTFSVDAGKRITVHAGAGANFFASVGGTDAKATFNAPAGRVDNIGAANAIMDEVSFTDDTEVFGDAYAKKISIATTKTGAFNKIVASGTVELVNDATADFKDGSTLVSTLAGTIDKHGIANFEGAISVQKGLGKSGFSLAEINFGDKAGKTQKLAGDFYAVDTTFLKTIAQATGATTFHGKLDATDTTFDLGTAGMTFTDGTLAAPNKFTGETTILTTFDGSTNGQLTLSGATTALDVTGVTKLTVLLNDNTKGRRKGGNPIRVIALANSATVANLGLDKLTVDPTGNNIGNTNVKWTFDADSLTFTPTDVSDTRAASVVAANGGTTEAKSNVVKIFDAVSGTDASTVADEWAVLSDIAPKAEAEAANRISSPTVRTASSAVTTALAQTVSSTTTARMQTLANPAAIRVTQADGVSAGAEDTLRYGAWGSPFYSQGVQKMRKGVSGYKSKTVGGTVGFDTMANDTMIVGVAATIAKTDLKHKDINAGDKTKADTLMFSIYGLQEINDDWFLQGVANFGSTKVKNTSKRIGADIANNTVSNSTATGKYDSMSWGGELLGGYNLNVTSMAVITPMLGLDYTRTNDGGFTETGTRNQNLSISKKSVDKAQVVAGVRAVMADIEQSGFVVTPEVHGFVRHALGSKNPKLTVKLDGAGELDTSNNAKLAKTTGNLGLGINASSGMMSYGLTYDAHMANKYVGHQGTFKVRVNF